MSGKSNFKPSADDIKSAFGYDHFEFNAGDGEKTGIATTKEGQFHTNEHGEPLYQQKYMRVFHFHNGLSFAERGNDKITLWLDNNGKVCTKHGRY